ncbi:tRNA(M-2-U44)-methyltransferase [Rhodotorula toruloides]|uniref:tRNA (uracil-O(2)-)-methyltransferase n=1 Tax=Rhodotorula toruloides TaxID=5286 RepID=A0A511KDH0_RHOTO|nr:tRNA(M-2-U44)-methyltransferase [Rhodotorula toruloides]
MPRKGLQPTTLASDAPHPLPRLRSQTSPSPLDWIPVVSLPVQCRLEHFQEGLLELVLQPEQSSSTILRADVQTDEERPGERLFELDGFSCTRRIRRRILPNRPQFDWAMEQECLFYERTTADSEGDREGLLLLLPDFEQLKTEQFDERLPYYHPQAYTLAFRFLPPQGNSALLRIDLIPLPSQAATGPLPPNDRLFRTCLALVNFAAKLCAGKADGWTKRVHHDVLVGKEEVQDLYQQLKDKYKTDMKSQSPRLTFRWMLHSWRESTDATKHVFEDVAIAAWLIILWRDMYADCGGRPPGGFVDVGCGNGLLVFILAAEGYAGFGFDLRKRKSWASYSSPTPDLRVRSVNPVDLISHALERSDSTASSTSTDDDLAWPFPADSFLIFNHADEMTPWCAFFAAMTAGDRVGFLNIPCCLHELVGRFERQAYTIPDDYLLSLPSPSFSTNASLASVPTLSDRYSLLHPFYAASPVSFSTSSSGASVIGGRYHAYQLYLAHLTLLCGFVPEREALRIPSTKNFGIVGRKRVWDVAGARREEVVEAKEKVREEVRRVVEEVKRKGEWKARKPEGKAGDREH